jgi:hypothetical protein
MPDVECPRCNATFPPSVDQKLVTCATCALVFTPHEVVHRPPFVDILDPPPSVQVTTEGDTITVLTKMSRIAGFCLLVGTIAFTYVGITNWSELSWMERCLLCVMTPGCSYLVLVQLRSYRIITIDPASFTHRIAPWPAPWSTTMVIARKTIPSVYVRTTTSKRGKRYRVSSKTQGGLVDLVVSRHADNADYIRDLVAKTWHISAE